MYQTLGAANPNQVLISSTTNVGYIHWDRSYEAFLLKKHNNRLLAVFKIGTKAAVSLEITLNGLGSTSYINLEIFLPKIQEFKNFKTYGLLGSYDDDISNDCKQRDGSNHKLWTQWI